MSNKWLPLPCPPSCNGCPEVLYEPEALTLRDEGQAVRMTDEQFAAAVLGWAKERAKTAEGRWALHDMVDQCSGVLIHNMPDGCRMGQHE